MWFLAELDWSAVGVLAVSILSGAVTVAWKLGGLERRVKDLDERLKGVEGELRRRPRR